MTNIISMKNTKQGNFAIIVGSEHEEIAFRVMAGIMAEIYQASTGVVAPIKRTLADVAKNVEGVTNQVKLSLNVSPDIIPTVKGLTGLSTEKQGNEIIAMLADRIPNYHHSKLRVFYADIEAETGAKLYLTHKRKQAKLTPSENGKFPNRKVDTAIRLIGAKSVYEYAKAYSV